MLRLTKSLACNHKWISHLIFITSLSFSLGAGGLQGGNKKNELPQSKDLGNKKWDRGMLSTMAMSRRLVSPIAIVTFYRSAFQIICSSLIAKQREKKFTYDFRCPDAKENEWGKKICKKANEAQAKKIENGYSKENIRGGFPRCTHVHPYNCSPSL